MALKYFENYETLNTIVYSIYSNGIELFLNHQIAQHLATLQNLLPMTVVLVSPRVHILVRL